MFDLVLRAADGTFGLACADGGPAASEPAERSLPLAPHFCTPTSCIGACTSEQSGVTMLSQDQGEPNTGLTCSVCACVAVLDGGVPSRLQTVGVDANIS
jgi:hypothetical protein